MKIIAAVDSSYGIGKCNSIPWHVSTDMKFFKKMTIGSSVYMGANTMRSLPRPLYDRENYVITSKDVLAGFKKAKVEDLVKENDGWVIGGEQIFRLALDRDVITEMLITHLHIDYDCDTFFPFNWMCRFERVESKYLERWVYVSRYVRKLF